MINFEADPFSEGVWITPSGSDPVLQGGSSVAVLFFSLFVRASVAPCVVFV